MKTVVIYATKHGTTKKAAELIAAKLTGEVSVLNIKEVKITDVEAADTVVIGGPFYIGMLRKPLKTFVQDHLETLLKKRVALFFCAGVEDEKTFEQELSKNLPEKLLQSAVFKDSVGFEFDFKKMSGIEKLMIGKVMGLKESRFNLKLDRIDELVKAVG